MAKKKPSSKKKQKTTKKRGDPVKKITINFWKTKMHSATMGIKKELQYQAKARQFTKEFDIIGEIFFNGDKKGEKMTKQVVALNKVDFEKPKEEKRLMMRTFTFLDDETGGNFKGGIEESVLESINQSIIADKVLSIFVAAIPGTDYIVRISRMRTLTGNKFGFPLLPDKNSDNARFIQLIGKIGAGDDFNIMEGDKKIGEIDGKKFDLGGKFDIEIDDEEFQYHKNFLQLMILFTSVLKFLKECENDTKYILDRVSNKKKYPDFVYTPVKQELNLLKNPRRTK
jgi:hypothetical protein